MSGFKDLKDFIFANEDLWLLLILNDLKLDMNLTQKTLQESFPGMSACMYLIGQIIFCWHWTGELSRVQLPVWDQSVSVWTDFTAKRLIRRTSYHPLSTANCTHNLSFHVRQSNTAQTRPRHTTWAQTEHAHGGPDCHIIISSHR